MELEGGGGTFTDSRKCGIWGINSCVCALFYTIDVYIHTQALVVFYKLWFTYIVLGFQALFFLLYFFLLLSSVCDFFFPKTYRCGFLKTRGPVGFSFRTCAPYIGFLGPALLPVPGHLPLIRYCRAVSPTAQKAPGRHVDVGISTGTA